MRIFLLFLSFLTTGISVAAQENTVTKSMEFPDINRHMEIIVSESGLQRNRTEVVTVYATGADAPTLLRETSLDPFNPDLPPLTIGYRVEAVHRTKPSVAVLVGFKRFYIVELSTGGASPCLAPGFTKDYGEDAQSGNVLNLHFDATGRYLLGTIQDFGTFIYDVTNPVAPRQVTDAPGW